MGCLELCRDQSCFRVVDIQEISRGDLLFFGRGEPGVDAFEPEYDKNGNLLNSRASPVKHVAIHTGFVAPEPLLVHANPYDAGVGLWPLSRFSEYKRYADFLRAQRLKA